MALAGCGAESTESKACLFFYRAEEENKSNYIAFVGCGAESTGTNNYLFLRCGEQENKGDDMVLAGCEGESTETKTYLLYIVKKKRTKATAWLLQVVEERVQRRRHTFFCFREEENKGDDMALAGCGGESTETKTYIFVLEKKRTKVTKWLLQVVEERVRDEDIHFCFREEENKGDEMALAGCGGESTETRTYLLYVVEKKITNTTTSMVM